MKVKNRLFIIVTVLGVMIFGVGIWMNTQQINHIPYTNQENHLMKNTDELENSEAYEIPSFEEYLGEDINLLKDKEIKPLKDLYEKIVKNEKAEKFDKADALWEEFDNLLREMGITVAYKDFRNFVETIKDTLDEKDYDKINDIYENIEKSNEYLETLDEHDKQKIEKEEKKVEKLWDEINKIIKPLGYDLDEILNHIENRNVLIALYDVKDGKIKYKPINKHKIEELSKEDIKKHKELWGRVRKIIPKDYLGRIVAFEINTDGKEEVMAHVNSPDNSNKIWRLAVDIKDAFDKNGKLVKEIDETLIHEFGHILTLNDSQMMKERNENSFAYTTDEGTTKKDAYLNKFYNRFWKDINKEWKEATEVESDENGENQALIDFYEKHKNEFVSEYASTNPEEDIAESFMQFVVQDKPKGKTVADKKILFFYEFKELVKMREVMKLNLN